MFTHTYMSMCVDEFMFVLALYMHVYTHLLVTLDVNAFLHILNTHTHTHTPTHVCVYVYIYIYTHMHICLSIYLSIYLSICPSVYIYIYIHRERYTSEERQFGYTEHKALYQRMFTSQKDTATTKSFDLPQRSPIMVTCIEPLYERTV